MKVWKLAILLVVFGLSAAACTVDENVGLVALGTLSCGSTSFSGSGGGEETYIGAGVVDLQLYNYNGTGSYMIFPKLQNKKANETVLDSQAEATRINLTHVDVSFDVPTDWDPIDDVRIPTSGYMEAEAEFQLGLSIMTENLRRQLEENFVFNSYKNLRPWAVTKPPLTDAAGNGKACGSEADCYGYPCVNGACVNYCSFKYGTRCGDGYVCDIGVGDFGICRQECTPGSNECFPLTNDAGDVLVSFECLPTSIPPKKLISQSDGSKGWEIATGYGMCIPANATVNPHKGEKIIAHIRFKGKDAAGETISSNELLYTLHVCRNCLMDYTNYYGPGDNCSLTGAEIADANKADGNDCNLMNQDYPTKCAYLGGCVALTCPFSTE